MRAARSTVSETYMNLTLGISGTYGLRGGSPKVSVFIFQRTQPALLAGSDRLGR